MERKPIVLYRIHAILFLINSLGSLFIFFNQHGTDLFHPDDKLREILTIHYPLAITLIVISFPLLLIKFVPFERELYIKSNVLLAISVIMLSIGYSMFKFEIILQIIHIINFSGVFIFTAIALIALSKYKDSELSLMDVRRIIENSDYDRIKPTYFSVVILFSIFITLIFNIATNYLSTIGIEKYQSASFHIFATIMSFVLNFVLFLLIFIPIRWWLIRVLTIYHNDEYIIGRNFLGNSYVIKREMVDSIKIKSALFFQIIAIRSDRLKKTVYMPYYSFSKRNIMELLAWNSN